MNLSELKSLGEAPEFLTEEGFITLSDGYLLPEETPRMMYKRVADSVANYLNKPELGQKFFDYIWKNWLCLSTPVAANSGTNRALNISCFGSVVPDTLSDIFLSYHETAMLSKNGGGTSKYWGNLRSRGSDVGKNGKSDGIIPWLKTEESTLQSVSQGGVRRGSGAQYLSIESNDIDEFIDIRRPVGDISRRCQASSFHHGVCISDAFMEKCKSGDQASRKLWEKILLARIELGEPYLFFSDNVNNYKPDVLKQSSIPSIKASNLCVKGDTKILTHKGWKEIKDLAGSFTYVWNGSNFSKSFVDKTSDNSKLVKVFFSDGSVLECTEYHDFYIQSKSKVIKKKTHELLIGDKIQKCNLPIIEFKKEMKDPYTQGFFSGDGFTFCNKNYIPLYGEKNNLLSKMNVTTIGKFDKKVNRQVCMTEKSYVKFDVPMDCSIKSKLLWLAGLLDSDGCLLTHHEYGTQSLQIGSINYDFLNNIRLMLQTLGITSKLLLGAASRETLLPDGKGGRKYYTCQQSYRLQIPQYGVNVLKSLGLKTHRLDLSKDYKPNRRSEEFVKVVKIEDNNVYAPTYCFNEPEKHKGIFNGVLAGNCNEIYLPSDEDHTFVCCLSSLNLARYDEWKDTDLIRTAIWFLDGVISEFLDKAKGLAGLGKAVRFAEKSRALGLGVLGWHTLLQSKMIPFDSFAAMQLNAEVFSLLDKESKEATKELAKEYGEPEWCKGFGIRNITRLAIAPTFSNSIISGGLSQGIEPLVANIFPQKTSKGTFIRKNKALETMLKEKGKDTIEVWDKINIDKGSVRNLSFLSDTEKSIFLTAREISQFTVIKQAAQRQRYIDQGQSLNLFFNCSDSLTNENRKKLGEYIHKVHWLAWESGLKGLYYCRSSSILSGDSVYREESECKACEG